MCLNKIMKASVDKSSFKALCLKQMQQMGEQSYDSSLVHAEFCMRKVTSQTF